MNDFNRCLVVFKNDELNGSLKDSLEEIQEGNGLSWNRAFARETTSASVVDLEVAFCLFDIQAMGKKLFGPAKTSQAPEVDLVSPLSPQKSASTNNNKSLSLSMVSLMYPNIQ